MGVQLCLLLRVSMHNQPTVEIFCLNTAIYTIIKQQLSGEELPSLLPLFQVDDFQEK